ncbi:hypothetical protein U1Q18_021779 [Sarracenia purpurea var. burkii]
MSHLEEANGVENLEFKWGKKKGVGGKKKEAQFYESFTYDDVDYTLYDCVYMYKEGEPEPYIGKLIKIWTMLDKIKKVKIQWFFRPSEILNWLGDEEALENEIFLASGEGAGVTNVNPLEAIAGKCNVVCISKDSRNPQPSEQELQMADHIFYRTFDVKHCTISDKMDDKVAGLEVKFIFNREDSERISDVPKLDSDKKEDAVACNQILQLSGQNPTVEVKTARRDVNSNDLMEKGSEDGKDSLIEHKSLPGGKSASRAALDSAVLATSSGQQGTASGDKASRYRIDSDNNDIKMNKDHVGHVEVEEKGKSAKDSGALENKPAKKSMADAKALATTTISSERKTKLGSAKDFLESDKSLKSAQDADALEGRPSKKARVDSLVKLSENKKNNSVQKLSINADGNIAKDLATSPTYGGKTKSEVASLGPDKDPKQKNQEMSTKLTNGKLLKVSAGDSPSDYRKTLGNAAFEITRRPDADRSKWFKAPWEERMKSAYEQGTLVQLSNLDQEYTSAEVEDIIWHAFKEQCTAKVVQRIAISSPHSGQAFIILKTRSAAERIVKELDDGCLMLSNGSPIVGNIVPPPCTPEKKSTFVGHLVIEKVKQQMQREMKEAVSTSHCSQPNNIEYEMAMEWRLLQSRSELFWKKLHKQQGEELRKLKANLKLKWP